MYRVHLYSANTLKTHLTHCQRNANNRQTGGFSDSVETGLVQPLDCQAMNSRLWTRSEGATTEGAAADTWNSQFSTTQYE